MSPRIQDHVQIERLLGDALKHLTLSGDVVDPDRSIRHLLDCLICLANAERLLNPGDGTDQPDVVIIRNLSHRHRRKLFARESTPETIARLLSCMGQPDIKPSDTDVLLVNEAIPAVWRILKGVRADARSQRPWGIYKRRALRTCKYLLVTWLVYEFARLVLPFGSWVIYYNDRDLKLPIAVRAEFDLFKDYEKTRPVPFCHRNGWSARWTGKLFAPRKDTYTFYIQSDDGARFWIDGTLIIDNWRDTSWLTSGKAATVELGGGKHSFRLEHYKRNGDGAMRVRWTGGGIPPNTVLGSPYVFKY